MNEINQHNIRLILYTIFIDAVKAGCEDNF